MEPFRICMQTQPWKIGRIWQNQSLSLAGTSVGSIQLQITEEQSMGLTYLGKKQRSILLIKQPNRIGSTLIMKQKKVKKEMNKAKGRSKETKQTNNQK